MKQPSSQKLLLLAESELNRAQLAEDLGVLAGNVRALTGRAAAIGSLTASAIGVVAGLIALQQGRTAEPPVASSWQKHLQTGISLLARLWRIWHPPGRDR